MNNLHVLSKEIMDDLKGIPVFIQSRINNNNIINSYKWYIQEYMGYGSEADNIFDEYFTFKRGSNPDNIDKFTLVTNYYWQARDAQEGTVWYIQDLAYEDVLKTRNVLTRLDKLMKLTRLKYGFYLNIRGYNIASLSADDINGMLLKLRGDIDEYRKSTE